jgi:hypothetical protein
VIRADGGGLRRLTRAAGADVGPRWSTSGAAIRYLHIRLDGRISTYEPWVVPLAGGPPRAQRHTRV